MIAVASLWRSFIPVDGMSIVGGEGVYFVVCRNSYWHDSNRVRGLCFFSILEVEKCEGAWNFVASVR